MRPIDADAMLDRLEEWNTDDPIDKALYNFAWNRIIEQPTIESEQRWIPVSERLPEENSDILVTYVEKDDIRIVPVNYGCGTWFDCFFDKVLNQVGVLAWMPPPEPYREDGAGAERRTDDLQ